MSRLPIPVTALLLFAAAEALPYCGARAGRPVDTAPGRGACGGAAGVPIRAEPEEVCPRGRGGPAGSPFQDVAAASGDESVRGLLRRQPPPRSRDGQRRDRGESQHVDVGA